MDMVDVLVAGFAFVGATLGFSLGMKCWLAFFGGVFGV